MIILQAISDTASTLTSASTNMWGISATTWFTVALVEFILIIILLLAGRQKVKNDELKYQKIREAKSNKVDMNEVMQSIYGSKALYKELSSKCHPDLFVNTEKEVVANEIFQEISRNKRDYTRLNELKQRAISELGIKL